MSTTFHVRNILMICLNIPITNFLHYIFIRSVDFSICCRCWGNQPGLSVKGIFSNRDCWKLSTCLLICRKIALSITPLFHIISNPVLWLGGGNQICTTVQLYLFCFVFFVCCCCFVLFFCYVVVVFHQGVRHSVLPFRLTTLVPNPKSDNTKPR